MPLNGDIKTFSVSAVGRMIHAENKTGVLSVTSGEYATDIYFKNGDIIFISGDLTEDLSFGSLLKINNIVAEEYIRKSLKLAQASGKRLGIVLLDQGYISKKQLVDTLRQQFKEALAHVLSWEEGVFNYSDGLNGYTEDIHLAIDSLRLIAEAQQWKEYRRLVPNDHIVFKIKSGSFKPDILSSDSASRVMLLIDGKRNVAQIMTETGLSRLAVYRSLAVLASQDVIAADKKIIGSNIQEKLDNNTIIKLYLNLFNEIIIDLSVELGHKKTMFLLEKSLKRTPFYNLLFCAFQPANDAAANFVLIRNHILNQKKNVLPQDLVNGFTFAVFNLLQEEYQLLGFGALKNTVNRTTAILDLASRNQRPLSRSLSNLFRQLSEDEDLIRGIKPLPETVIKKKMTPPEKRRPIPYGPEDMGTESILAFYSIIIQILQNDLQQEIGAKASDLLQDAFISSGYYDKFLCKFDFSDSVEANVNRIVNHVKTRNDNLNNQEMVMAFQQILLALLQSENRLLGNKAVQTSLLNIEEHMASPTRKRYKPLADLLFTFLKKKI